MLILLDVDGVMVPANSWKKPEFHDDGFAVFSSKSASALQKIITETGATILLTTSHKTKYNLVLTSSNVGLTDELAEHAISILKKSALNLV